MSQTITYYNLYIRVPNPTMGKCKEIVKVLGDDELEENYTTMFLAKERVTEIFEKFKTEYNNNIHLEFVGDNVDNCFPQFNFNDNSNRAIALNMEIRKKHITFIE